MSFTRENVYQVWDNDCGYRWEVCEDPDGLGLCEIRYVEDSGKVGPRITLPTEAAALLRDCIGDFLKDHET